MRTSSYLTLKCAVALFTPDLSTEVRKIIVVDNAPPQKNNCVTLKHCLNILIHGVKLQSSHLSFNAYFLPCRWFVWNTPFLMLKTTLHLCCNGQFAVKAWNKAAWASTIYTNCSIWSVSFSHMNYRTECLMISAFRWVAAYCITSPALGNYSRWPVLQTRRSGVCVTCRWRVLHVWPSLWCLSRNTAVGGTGAWRWQQRTTLSSAGRLGNSC